MFLCVTLVVHNEDLEITKQALQIEFLPRTGSSLLLISSEYCCDSNGSSWLAIKVQMSFVFVEEYEKWKNFDRPALVNVFQRLRDSYQIKTLLIARFFCEISRLLVEPLNHRVGTSSAHARLDAISDVVIQMKKGMQLPKAAVRVMHFNSCFWDETIIGCNTVTTTSSRLQAILWRQKSDPRQMTH